MSDANDVVAISSRNGRSSSNEAVTSDDVRLLSAPNHALEERSGSRRRVFFLACAILQLSVFLVRSRLLVIGC